MPAGRKSGKGSGARAKTTSKSARKPSNGGKTAHGGAPCSSSNCPAAGERRESCPTPQLLPASQPDNEIEGMDDEKLSELSAEEPDSSECE